MTPAEEIQAAADKLNGLLAATTDTPWSRWTDLDGKPGWHGMLLLGNTDREDPNPVAQMYTGEDADYVAAMDPLVGLALACWLEFEAGLLERAPQVQLQPRIDHALAVARAINQEAGQ
ncbi:hypothetical protein [Streptomyces sp. t39]|uniref:hypothetical protein n=1 Tax=Streptomyces sp. t39 TaxID=1828156 RepID=UPI0011CD7808|nr:hypothetical protein [Streptomyces sp. t39]TXS50151.1 hypothetical protein EAO77_27975 [Streptomyces sp. t39]